MKKPSLLIISHVLPIPGRSGQQQRVYMTLKALKPYFKVTFLGLDTDENITDKIKSLCDDIILLKRCYGPHFLNKLTHRIIGLVHQIFFGIRFSNYILSEVEFTKKRVSKIIRDKHFDIALFEYWHAAKAVVVFKDKNTITVLDTHNILWHSFDETLKDIKLVPSILKKIWIKKYRDQEALAWKKFDIVLTINDAEYQEIRDKTPKTIGVWNIPMGIELKDWPYSWLPANPLRVAYYGGLGNPVRERSVMDCYERIMPLIWNEMPKVEFWIVGSNPSQNLLSLKKDPRVNITGYVEKIQNILNTMSLIICPWKGTFGFRSRFIELMALGVPIVSTPDSVYGMNLQDQIEICLHESPEKMAESCLSLLKDPNQLKGYSERARKKTEEQFSFENTYEMFSSNLLKLLKPTTP